MSEVEESKLDPRLAKKGASAEEGKNKNLSARSSLAEKARLKLRNGWRNDDNVLNTYFQSCVANWKIYEGERIPKQVMKLQVIYRQAMYGDCTSPPPQNLKSLNGLKWQAWIALKGMPVVMAKRRFITYLAEINPALVDVMPDEKPPDGFCRDDHGNPICAKCNTVSGCGRPLLDQFKVDMRDQLFDSDELHEPPALRGWIRNGLEHQQCVWGKHKAVASADIKQYALWFNKDENGGYKPYEPTSVYDIVRDLLTYHFEVAYDMQTNAKEYLAEVINAQCVKVEKLRSIYQELSGERFSFEAPCRSKSVLCEELRAAENGRNHTHPYDLLPPTQIDVDDYESSISLREQCGRLGLSRTTGVVESVQQRCLIYRTRIADYFKGLQISTEATKRLDAHADRHGLEKKKIKTLSTAMIQRQASDACHSMKISHVLTLIRRGCDPNVQTTRGLTPMLTAVLTQAPTELIEELVQRKCNINAVTMYGLTPLMMACRLKDTKMIHALMRLGCSALQDGGRAGAGLTAMHWCAIHGSEEEAKIILEYVKEGGGDSLRMSRVLDGQSTNGDTPMMLAARIRNGLMCRALAGLGANPNVRNDQNRNACNIARTAGWTELAEWLEKKVGAGVAKLETYSDLQYDKMVRYGKIRLEENIEEFGRLYLSLVHESTAIAPLGPPSIARTMVEDVGPRAYESQLNFSNNHQQFFMLRDPQGRDYVISNAEQKKTMDRLNEILNESMIPAIKKGAAAPNTEAQQKPLPWTTLMCAVCLNNVRAIKLLVRDGADPNHPNMQGTTALMLAAQLQNLEALVELLVIGADMARVDNFGYTALAYATSLPIPQNMVKEASYLILDGDTEGPKKRDASSLLKMAMKTGVGTIRDTVAQDADEASRVSVENHFRFMRLLENFGLSRLQTVKQIVEVLDTANWRIGQDDHVKIVAQEFSETASERDERERVEKHRLSEAEHYDVDDVVPKMRCPICTLTLPCPHFFKEETLSKFITANAPEGNTNGGISSGSALQDMLNAQALRKNFAAQSKANARNKILTEVGIADRNTDRSIAFNNKYRARERELDKLAAARKEAAEAKQQGEQDAADEADRGIGWGENTDKETGQIFYEHVHTNVRWNAVPDGQGQTYFVNAETGETLWDVPGLAEWLVKFRAENAAAAEAAAIEAEKKRIKDEKRAIRDAKKNKEKKGQTAIQLAQEAAAKEKKDKQEAARQTEKEFTAKLLAKAQEAADEKIDLGGEPAPEAYIDDGMVTPKKKKKHLSTDGVDPNFTPKSILKKDGAEKKGVGIRFVEGDIDTAPEVRKDWFAVTATDTDTDSNEDTTSNTRADPGEERDPSEFEVPVVDPDDEVTLRPGSPNPLSPTDIKGEGLPLKKTAYQGLGNATTVDNTVAVLNNAVLGMIEAEVDQAKQHGADITSHPIGGVLDEDKELTKDEKFRLRKGVNPYPPSQRRLMSFTKESFLAVDGLLKNEKPLTDKEKKKIMRENTNKSSILAALEEPRPGSAGSKGGARRNVDIGKRRSSAPKALLREPGKVQVSGWVFVSCSTPDLRPPIDKVELPVEMWASMIEHIREKFNKDWTSRLVLRSMVSPNSLKVTTPRCFACQVGFVRTKPPAKDSEHPENNLCFACIVRRELYERAQQVFPRSFRRKASSVWPFKEKDKKDGSDSDEDENDGLKMVPFGEPLTPLHKINNTLDVTSPVHSRRLAEIDIRETTLDMARSGHPINLGHHLDSMSLDSGSLTMGSLTMGLAPNGMLTSVDLGDGSIIDLQKSLDSLPTSLSKVSVPSVFSNDSDDTMGHGAQAKLPQELNLIPFLLAKGQFEEVDRMVRVALAQKTINEGEGIIYLVNALALQADMYKLMGLYPLALAMYLESFDLTVSMLGFNCSQAMNAMQWVSSCLIKMRCPALSKEWTHNVCRALETESLSDNMWSQSKVLVEADRAMRKKLVKNEMVWKNMIVPVIAQREADPQWNHKSRNFRWILFKLCGYPAVYRMFANTDGYSIVARQAFEAHCKAVDPNRLGMYCRFVTMCFRLRTINNNDTYRHIIQELVQKFLAMSLVDTCEIAKVYRGITSDEHMKAVSTFLHFGLPVGIEVFDAILFHSIKVLGNSKEYLFFYMRDGGAGLRERNTSDTLACFHALATKIQVPILIKLARIKMRKIREARAAEKARQLAEFNEANGIREETPEEIKERKKAERRAEKKRKQQELIDAGLSVEEDF